MAIIRRKLEGPDAGRRIIYDGDLIHKFFGIGPGRALTAITLIKAVTRHRYSSVEVQISERLRKLIARETWQACETRLYKQLPVVINDHRTVNIKIELDGTGGLQTIW